MDNLRVPNQLIYFTNDELHSMIGFSTDKSNKPNMWFKERDDIITKAKFLSSKKLETQLPDYINVDKISLKFNEYNSPCMCATIDTVYTSVITLNTNSEHKATYKLDLYKHNSSKIGYTSIGTYYSYFS